MLCFCFEISPFIASIKEPHLQDKGVSLKFSLGYPITFFTGFCSPVSLRAQLNYESRGLIIKLTKRYAPLSAIVAKVSRESLKFYLVACISVKYDTVIPLFPSPKPFISHSIHTSLNPQFLDWRYRERSIGPTTDVLPDVTDGARRLYRGKTDRINLSELR